MNVTSKFPMTSASVLALPAEICRSGRSKASRWKNIRPDTSPRPNYGDCWVSIPATS